jgi:hypothetical protein
LPADGDGAQVRPHVAIEAVLVHAEIRRCVAEANEARRDRYGAGHVHQRPSQTLWFRSFRVELSLGRNYRGNAQESEGEFLGNIQRNSGLMLQNGIAIENAAGLCH